jgi:hypothetical protein
MMIEVIAEPGSLPVKILDVRVNVILSASLVETTFVKRVVKALAESIGLLFNATDNRFLFFVAKPVWLA